VSALRPQASDARFPAVAAALGPARSALPCRPGLARSSSSICRAGRADVSGRLPLALRALFPGLLTTGHDRSRKTETPPILRRRVAGTGGSLLRCWACRGRRATRLGFSVRVPASPPTDLTEFAAALDCGSAASLVWLFSRSSPSNTAGRLPPASWPVWPSRSSGPDGPILILRPTGVTLLAVLSMISSPSSALGRLLAIAPYLVRRAGERSLDRLDAWSPSRRMPGCAESSLPSARAGRGAARARTWGRSLFLTALKALLAAKWAPTSWVGLRYGTSCTCYASGGPPASSPGAVRLREAARSSSAGAG